MFTRHAKLCVLGALLGVLMTLNACQCLLVLPLKRFQPYNPTADAGDITDTKAPDLSTPIDVLPPELQGDQSVEPLTESPQDTQRPDEPAIDAQEPTFDASQPDEPMSIDEPMSVDEPTVDEPTVEEPIPEIPCAEGDSRRCLTNKPGVCRPGISRCTNGKWTPCESLEQPSEEICDGFDNDCDGQIDAIRRDCPYQGPQVALQYPPCRVGTQICLNGFWSRCTGEILPGQEICNGKDDDCNGKIDEWLPIQSVGTPTLITADKGYLAHLYLVATSTGYALGWSETGTQRVMLSRLKADGSRATADLEVTNPGEFGNIHGLSHDGKQFIVSWDTDKGGNGGDALFVILDALSGNRISGPNLLAKGGRMVNPQVAFGLGYLGVTWSDFGNNRLYVQTFSNAGLPLSQAGFFPLSTQNSPYPGLAFSTDRLATVWNTPTNKLQFAVFDSLRNQIGTTVDIPNPGASPADATVAGDLNGFLVVWVDRATGRLLGQRMGRDGKVVGQQSLITPADAQTPIMKATSYGGIISWLQKKNGVDGVAVGRVDVNGKLLTNHSWFAVPGIQPYMALAWTDQGQGQGRGAIAWLDDKGALRVAPLGCR